MFRSIAYGVATVLVSATVAAKELPPEQQRGLATGYSAWSPEWMKLGKGKRVKSSTGKPFCWYHRKVKRGDAIIAHRSLPCGTKVYVQTLSSGRGAWLTVGDRGPYGACVKRGVLKEFIRLRPKRKKPITWAESKWCRKIGDDYVWYVKRHRRWPGTWRGIADISHVARKRIGHNGFQRVAIRYWKGGRRLASSESVSQWQSKLNMVRYTRKVIWLTSLGPSTADQRHMGRQSAWSDLLGTSTLSADTTMLNEVCTSQQAMLGNWVRWPKRDMYPTTF